MHDLLLTVALQLGVLLLLCRAAPKQETHPRGGARPLAFQPTLESAQQMVEQEFGEEYSTSESEGYFTDRFGC